MNLKTMLARLRRMIGQPQATPETDPSGWLNALLALPDPDPILRGMGRAEQVYNAMVRDTHLLGDVRSIRGNFRSHDWRLLPGDDGDAASLRAHRICETWMRKMPPCGLDGHGVRTDWLEVMWQMTSSILFGYRAHEVVWGLVDGLYLPTQVLDRPNRRFAFTAAGEPLLISRNTGLQGQPVEPFTFLVSRHMADAANPYGIALLSSCFYLWNFKNGGLKYLVKYCERHGLPWPVGRYPVGSLDDDIDKFEAAIANMIDSGYVVAPEGTGLELLVPNSSGSGQLPQAALIDLCNREMSKALTGQSMVAELQGVGARAASETAAARQGAINDADRDIPVATMSELFRWMTLWNVGEGVAPPVIEFYQNEKAGKDRAETYAVAARLGANPSKSALLEELGIPEATDEKDRLQMQAPTGMGSNVDPATGKPVVDNKSDRAPAGGAVELSGLPGLQFARAAGMTDEEAVALATEAADQAIEDHMIAPVAAMLARFEAEGKTLAEFRDALEDLVGEMDDEALREVLDRSLSYAMLRGAATKAA